jgi:hypothetical protein
MFIERRSSERHRCHGIAKVHFGIGSLPRECMIIDISEGGARIIIERADVPDEFTLILPTGHRRPCRLAWRLGCEFGTEFLDRVNYPSHQAATRTTAAFGLRR